MDPFSEVTDEQKALQRELMQSLHATFIDFVKHRHGGALKAPSSDDTWSGKVWTGADAAAGGLIDGVGEMNGILQSKFSEKPRFQVFGAPKLPWWAESFGASVDAAAAAGRLGAHGGRGVDGGGVAAMQAAMLAGPAAIEAALEVANERVLWGKYGL